MTDAPELLPCPFCGGDASFGGDVRGSFVNCVECLSATDHLMNEGVTKQDAAEAWNTRADLPPTLAAALAVPEIAALVNALEWIRGRKPSDIRPDGEMDMPHRGHGEAAYDMWACANATLANLKGHTP